MSQARTAGPASIAAAARQRRTRPGSAPQAAWTGLSTALHAEWTKVRTAPGTFWLLVGTVALTVGVSAAVVAANSCPAHTLCPVDTTKLSLTGLEVGQAVVAVLAVLMISGEYSTGMIRTTLTAMPRRSVVLAAKAAILASLVLVAGAIAVFGCVLAGRFILPGNGFTPARGFALLSLTHGPTLRAAVGAVLYLVLIALFSLGVATMIRDSATAMGTVLGLLYLAPIIAGVLASDPVWQRRIERYAPTNAGLTILDTTGLRSLPITPWVGLGVLAAWAAAALLAGGAVLRLRDA